MATEAMKAGKHVISAVPAGMSAEELEQLLECVKKTGLKYMMAETSYYHAEIMTCREWRQQGKFGTIFYSEAEYHRSEERRVGKECRFMRSRILKKDRQM